MQRIDAKSTKVLIEIHCKYVTYEFISLFALFPDETPKHILAMLSENPPVRKALEAKQGERFWSLADHILGSVERHLKEPNVTRKEALNLAVAEQREKSQKLLEQPEETSTSTSTRTNKSRTKAAVDTPPNDPVEDVVNALLERSAMVEMLLDTRPALWAYKALMTPAHASAMGRDAGASFMAHFWLGLRCLLKVRLPCYLVLRGTRNPTDGITSHPSRSMTSSKARD